MVRLLESATNWGLLALLRPLVTFLAAIASLTLFLLPVVSVLVAVIYLRRCNMLDLPPEHFRKILWCLGIAFMSPFVVFAYQLIARPWFGSWGPLLAPILTVLAIGTLYHRLWSETIKEWRLLRRWSSRKS